MIKKVFENEQLKVGAVVEVDNATMVKSIALISVNDGVGHVLRKLNVHDVTKGKGVDAIVNVVPDLLLGTDEESKTQKMQEINKCLMKVLQDTQSSISSGMTWDFKKVHQEVCKFVKNDPRTDYFIIAEDKCKVRGTELQSILDMLDTGWSAHRFAKTLQLHNMLYTDGGRLQKWLTDSSGKGKQYRAYVFDTVFKRLELDE